MEVNIKYIKSAISDAVHKEDPNAYNFILEHGIAVLSTLTEYLSKDLPIEILERYEYIWKSVIQTQLVNIPTSETARQLALFQKNLGFLFKYKPYAIKASTPFGYSIFNQSEGDGFSYQRHISYKTEVFHFIEVKQGGYVFICDYDDWIRIFSKKSFSAWLSGHPDDRYEQYRVKPNSGDVFVINRLNVVHAVIGCVLEEFATVSTDMVDRLFDQNAGKTIPAQYNRQFAIQQLQDFSAPLFSHNMEKRLGNYQRSRITPVKITGGQQTPLARTSEIAASTYVIEPLSTSEVQIDEGRVATIFASEGKGRIIIGDLREVKQLTPPTISVRAGDVLMIPAGIYYGFVNEDTSPLKFSEHKVSAQASFVNIYQPILRKSP